MEELESGTRKCTIRENGVMHEMLPFVGMPKKNVKGNFKLLTVLIITSSIFVFVHTEEL